MGIKNNLIFNHKIILLHNIQEAIEAVINRISECKLELDDHNKLVKNLNSMMDNYSNGKYSYAKYAYENYALKRAEICDYTIVKQTEFNDKTDFYKTFDTTFVSKCIKFCSLQFDVPIVYKFRKQSHKEKID